MRHKHFLFLIGFALSVSWAIIPRCAFGWNSTGHEIIALIAWDQLSPPLKAKITALLQEHPDYVNALTRESTPAGEERDADAFAIAATWPDLIRNPSFGKSHLLEHASWHYVDIPFITGDVKPTEAAPDFAWRKGVEPTNVVQALKKMMADLNDPEIHPPERAIALCWLEHLVGDIHQPLHATSHILPELPGGDHGGNNFMVSNSGQVTNLHLLWDGMLGGYMDLGKIKETAHQLEAAHPKKEFEKELAVTEFANLDGWAKGSFEQAKTAAYLDGKLPGVFKSGSSRKTSDPAVPELPDGYMGDATVLARRNAALAGYRLAALLEQIFGEKKP